MITNKDKQKFSHLFETHHAALFRFANTYVCCPSQAEDIVQEVFIKLWESPDIRINKSIKSYLFLMVRNRCIDHLRSLNIEDKNNKKLIEALILSDSANIEFDDEVSSKIKSAIMELPEQCRNVFHMHIFDGLKHAEIAEELGISESAVKVQVYRAKNKLRDRLHSLKNIIVLLSTTYHRNKKISLSD